MSPESAKKGNLASDVPLEKKEDSVMNTTTTTATLGEFFTKGKTKEIYWSPNCDSGMVIVVSKNDITAGDGAKHDIIPDKGNLANQTTCNVFELLKACGLPVAFVKQNSANSFITPCCEMFLYEVVARREAHGSYLDRNPHLKKGHLFPRLISELFLKTSGKTWVGIKSGKVYELAKDDPLLVVDFFENPEARLYFPGYTSEERAKNPSQGALVGQKPFLVLPVAEIFKQNENEEMLAKMQNIAKQAFLILEKAWQLEGRKLVDFKVEFGLDRQGNLLLADVIDNDSWRVIENGAYIDKQVYRDGGALDDVAAKYKQVAEITGHFRLPRQRIILWRGSEKDNVDAFINEVRNNCIEFVNMLELVTCSVHKEPEKAIATLNRLVQEVPDSVVVSYVGKSNGAGPTLSAASTVPVITVPASVKDFPNDVWSSLRAPSKVPVMTVLEPANAMLAAMQILSARNPQLYAYLRGEVEKRLVNTVSI